MKPKQGKATSGYATMIAKLVAAKAVLIATVVAIILLIKYLAER